MSADEDDTGQRRRLDAYLARASSLCDRCHTHSHIPGVSRLLKNCQAEQQFLRKLCKKKVLEASHLSSTNLGHLEALLLAVESLPHVVQVQQPFSSRHSNHPVVVDVVCNHGYTWVKVIARKAQALHLVWAGVGQYGERSVVDQADLYLACAADYPVTFSEPQVLFWFASGVTAPVSAALESRGVAVYGQLAEVPTGQLESATGTTEQLESATGQLESAKEKTKTLESAEPSLDSSEDECQDGDGEIPTASEFFSKLALGDSSKEKQDNYEINQRTSVSDSECLLPVLSPPPGESLARLFVKVPVITKINIDITSLICLASNLCHGRCQFEFSEAVLTQQAVWERQRPVLPKMLQFMEGKQLYACQTAITDFRSIIETVGGDTEKQRAADLLRRITVIPDDCSARAERLQITHQVKQRAKTIFGSGDSIKAVTMTANSGFVRAAMKQGINFAVYLHESRALTEQKEPKVDTV